MDESRREAREPGPVRRRFSRERMRSALPKDGARGQSWYSPPGAGVPPDALALLDDAGLAEAASASGTGAVVFRAESDCMLVLPPFPLDAPASLKRIEAAPLLDLLARPRAYAAFLLRRGGYTIGFFRGDYLVASKTDRRFVKNRHRKGGQSQRRFDRIREKQIYELYESACTDARATLEPFAAEIDHVLLGGDRLALAGFLKQCSYFDHFGDRVMQRRLQVAGDPRRASLDVVPADVSSCEVWTWDPERVLDGGA